MFDEKRTYIHYQEYNYIQVKTILYYLHSYTDLNNRENNNGNQLNQEQNQYKTLVLNVANGGWRVGKD